MGDSCHDPKLIREKLKSGELQAADAIASLVEATRNAMLRRPSLVLAHLFSILPKVGLNEADVAESHLHELARTALETGAKIEIDERWHCPSLRTAKVFRSYGVSGILQHRQSSS